MNAFQTALQTPPGALGVASTLCQVKCPPLDVVSRLRRAKSKRPRLQRRDAACHVSTVRVFCKAGALLLTRRSIETTPSGSIAAGFRAESPVINSTGQRPVWTGAYQQPALKGRNPVIDSMPPFQGFGERDTFFHRALPCAIDTGLSALLARRSVDAAPSAENNLYNIYY
jgi:hypothetical protein